MVGQTPGTVRVVPDPCTLIGTPPLWRKFICLYNNVCDAMRDYSTPEVTEYGSVERTTLQIDDKSDPGSDTQINQITGSIKDCSTDTCT